MFKKINLLYILLVAALLVTACGSKDLTKGKTALEIIEASYGKMAELKNYDMDMEMNMKMQMPNQEPLNLDIKGKATVFQSPIQMKMVLEMKNTQTDETMNMEQYVEQSDTGVNVYQKAEGQWFKMSINDPALVEMMKMDPAKNINLFLDNLQEAKILGEEEIGQQDTVKIELVASSEVYEDILKQMPGMNLNPADLPVGPEVFSKMGDMKYIIWVDKVTLNIVKTSMDLSENMRNLGQALVDTNQLPVEIAEMFKNVEMSMSYTMANLDTAEQFTIPEEAKNAQEMPLNP